MEARAINYQLSLFVNFFSFVHCSSCELDCVTRTICIDAVYCYGPSSVVCQSVCLLVCLFVTLVSTAKTAEPIEI